MAGLVATLSVDRARMRAATDEGHITATALADALVWMQVPFRAAHHAVGRLVAEADRRGVPLAALDDEAIAGVLAASEDVTVAELALRPEVPSRLRAASTVEAALASCDVVGGTAPVRVADAVAAASARIEAELARKGRTP